MVVGGEGVPAEVMLVEPIGSEALVHMRAAGEDIVARVEAELRPAVGDAVVVTASPSRVHLFDRETGERIAWS